MEMKVNGLKIYYSDNALDIVDSHVITNVKKMKIILEKVFNKKNGYFMKRNKKSLLNEWIVTNIFYKVHLFRSKTKDCHFKPYQRKITSLIFFILSRPSILKYYYKKAKDFISTKKQTIKYKKYIKEHKKNIKRAYEEFVSNKSILELFDEIQLKALWERVLVHDSSKYSKEEFIPYRKYFFPINQEEKIENKEAFEKAWNHHWRSNPHHWQYRKNKKTFNKNSQEEVLDVLENVLDWLAMGYKFNDRPYQYYNNNKNNIVLCKEEKEYLESIINLVDAEYINKEGLNDTSKE